MAAAAEYAQVARCFGINTFGLSELQAADKAIAASFAPAGPPSVLLIMDVDGGGTTDPAPGPHPYPAGSVVGITATPDDGWEFAGWSTLPPGKEGAIADTAAASTTVTVNEEITVVAHFQQVGGGATNVPLIAGVAVAGAVAVGTLLFFLLVKRRRRPQAA